MEKRPVLCINDVDSNRCAMLYTPLEYSTVLEQAQLMGGNLLGNRGLFYRYMDQKFILTGPETWDFARRKFPEMLTLEIGNPDNINEEYEFRIIVYGVQNSGKTALIDQLRYSSMKNSENNFENSFQLGDDKFKFFEMGDHTSPEQAEIMKPEFLHMLIFILDSTDPQSLPEGSHQIRAASSEFSGFSLPLILLITKIDHENSTINAEQVMAQLGENKPDNVEILEVSCKNGKGMENVRASIDRMVQRIKN